MEEIEAIQKSPRTNPQNNKPFMEDQIMNDRNNSV